MAPRGEGRHCDRCQTTVIDLSRRTRAQAEAILRAHGGEVCGRVRANARGEAVFAPEPVRGGLVPIALAGLLAACTTTAAPDDPAELRAEPDVTTEPDDAVGLALPATGSFGGSLATGVMLPIGAAPPVVVASAVVPPTHDEVDAVQPTDEQRALTRRKHQRHVSYTPPQHHILMGRMRPSR